MSIGRVCAWLVLALAVSGGAAGSFAGEKFFGGEIKKGKLAVQLSKNGVIDSIAWNGVKLAQCNGGLSTSGSKDDEWKPWAPQSWAKEVALEKEETAECAVIVAKGSIVPRGGSGQSFFVVTTRIYDGKITQECKLTTSIQDQWRRCGSGWQIEAAAFGSGSAYRADEGEAKTFPEARGNRNLIYKPAAARIELLSPACRLTFVLDGVKACLFDDRKPESERKIYNLEFGGTPQEITDERGSTQYETAFNVTITVGDAQAK